MGFTMYLHTRIRQIICLGIAAAGIILVGCGIYTKKHISSAQTEVHKMTDSRNALVKAAGRQIEKQFGNAAAKVRWFFIGGTLLIAAGGYLWFRWPHRHR
jgi:hypothetical protein